MHFFRALFSSVLSALAWHWEVSSDFGASSNGELRNDCPVVIVTLLLLLSLLLLVVVVVAAVAAAAAAAVALHLY